MKRFIVLALVIVTLSGCSGLGKAAFGLLAGGGGPNVNAQVGKTNTQTLGTTTVNEQKVTFETARTVEQTADKQSLRAESIGTIEVTNVEPWVLVVLMFFAVIVGSAIDDPIKAGIKWLFRRRKNGIRAD